VQDFLPKLASAVVMSLKTQRYAIQALQELEKKQCLEGKNPLVTCCVVSWIAAARTGEPITQQEFAKAAGVSTVSIRNNLKSILKVLKK